LEGGNRFKFEAAVTHLFGETEESHETLKTEKLLVGLKFEKGNPNTRQKYYSYILLLGSELK
jgi:hypothetical protein